MITVMYDYPLFLLAGVQEQVKGEIIEGFYGELPMSVLYNDIIMTTRSLSEAKDKWSGDGITYQDSSLPKPDPRGFSWAINPHEIHFENNVLIFKDLDQAGRMANSILAKISITRKAESPFEVLIRAYNDFSDWSDDDYFTKWQMVGLTSEGLDEIQEKVQAILLPFGIFRKNREDGYGQLYVCDMNGKLHNLDRMKEAKIRKYIRRIGREH